MKVNKKLVVIMGVAVATLAVAGGVIFSQQSNSNSTNNNQAANTQAQQQKTNTVSYQGVDGKTAIELLKSNAKKVVTKTDPSLGEYVVSINGEDGNGSKYWLFYIDGKASSVGAGEYKTKTGETIEWRLE